jgi:hypothetical protein
MADKEALIRDIEAGMASAWQAEFIEEMAADIYTALTGDFAKVVSPEARPYLPLAILLVTSRMIVEDLPKQIMRDHGQAMGIAVSNIIEAMPEKSE